MKSGAFSLIEVLVAVAIFGLGMVTLSISFDQVLRNTAIRELDRKAEIVMKVAQRQAWASALAAATSKGKTKPTPPVLTGTLTFEGESWNWEIQTRENNRRVLVVTRLNKEPTWERTIP